MPDFGQNLEMPKTFHYLHRPKEVLVKGVCKNREKSKSVKMSLNNPKQSFCF